MSLWNKGYEAASKEEEEMLFGGEEIAFGLVVVGERDDDNLTIFLPHQCDEWHIGSARDAEILIRDLNKAITYLNNKNRGA